MAEKTSARDGAIWLVGQVLGERRLLSELLAAPRHLRQKPVDRARAQRLATQTLRGLEKADRVLKPYLRKMPPLAVRNVLRLAATELCQGGDAHGIVNEAVAAVKRNKRTLAYGGMVNAVLRKVAADGPSKWNELRDPHLPKWLRGPLAQAYSPNIVAAMERAHFTGAPIDVTLRDPQSAIAETLPGSRLPTGSIRLSGAGQISALPGYEDGEWWVQDAAAALPVKALGDVSGLATLDMCAAPGGKTLQLAAAGAKVITGGTPLERTGNYFPPTIIDCSDAPDVPCLTSEFFGPVLSVLSFDTEAEAVTIANDTEYGLSSGIITANEERALEMARSLQTGMCHVNCSSVNDEPHVPFGGSKASGLGRHGGRWSMETFTETRWITLDRGSRPYPPVF